MKQYLVKDLPVKFVKETIKAPLRLKGMQFFSDPNTPPPAAEDTPLTEQTPPADDKEETPIDGQKEPKLDDATKTFIEKMVQSAEDRVRSKYSKELNATKKELENYKTASMTAQEKAEYEMKQLQEQLEERERILHQKEMQSAAADGLSAIGLDLKFVDFVIGSDVEDTKSRVSKFNDLFSSALEAKVVERFKAAGREIHVSGGTGTGFTREQVNSMSQDEINANWAQIQKDMRSWGK
ncbi:ribonuclease [Bacillus thuringiensis serovar pingluonsis]|uniref:Ribonuclease n=1 Tax=Bacillus thuringiensis serovar pingluonsis TaxID=180881 RepID=A0A2C9YMZ1_BACTU|nr:MULTISPECIES: DUF4355 domain-containing protein [Bacillus cereus group]MEB9684536.1 DUF4355 domain-containing protein [Bacillus anthracis]OTY38793.1 ribonuclease [Bacillus thuringiensis serovar pingluonsis]